MKIFSILLVVSLLLLAQPVVAEGRSYHRATVQGLGALFTVDEYPPDFLPPLTYDFYLTNQWVSEITLKYLKDNRKEVIVVLYQEAHPWPETHRIDALLGSSKAKYIDIVTVFEETYDSYLNELNDTYDYIKANYPGAVVYQWPHTNFFDFTRLNELHADGFVIDPRWHWSNEFGPNFSQGPGDFESKYLYPVLATGKPVINFIFVGAMADLAGYPEWWQYSIGQYWSSQKHKVPVGIVQPFMPGYETLTLERLKIILNYRKLQ